MAVTFQYTINDSLINLRSSDGSLLRSFNVPAETNHDETIQDSTVEIKKSDLTVLSTINLKAETDDEYIVPDSYVRFVDANNDEILTYSILADTSDDILLDLTTTSTVNIENTENTLLDSTTLYPGTDDLITIDDSEININGNNFTSLPSTLPLNITVKNLYNQEVGSKIGNDWVIPITYTSDFDFLLNSPILALYNNKQIVDVINDISIPAGKIEDIVREPGDVGSGPYIVNMIYDGTRYIILYTTNPSVGANNYSKFFITYSTDLKNWTVSERRFAGANLIFNGIKFLNNTYIVYGRNNTSNAGIYFTSTDITEDLTTWTGRVVGTNINDVIYNGSDYIFLNATNTINITNDFTTYTTQTVATNTLNSIIYDGTNYVISGNNSRIYYSTNLTTWNTQVMSGGSQVLSKIVKLNGVFITYNQTTGSPAFYYSTNLTSWTTKILSPTHGVITDINFYNGNYYIQTSNNYINIVNDLSLYNIANFIMKKTYFSSLLNANYIP